MFYVILFIVKIYQYRTDKKIELYEFYDIFREDKNNYYDWSWIKSNAHNSPTLGTVIVTIRKLNKVTYNNTENSRPIYFKYIGSETIYPKKFSEKDYDRKIIEGEWGYNITCKIESVVRKLVKKILNEGINGKGRNLCISDNT